jgi:hypothetical protein
MCNEITLTIKEMKADRPAPTAHGTRLLVPGTTYFESEPGNTGNLLRGRRP